MRGAGRRRPNDSLARNHTPAPSAQPSTTGARDSDASFCSSRPSTSSAGLGRSVIPISDRSYQLSATRAINAFLASHSLPFSLKPSLPSAKDIDATLRFVLSRLDYPSTKPEDDLPIILKQLNCPIKPNKSALRAPSTPHSWPSILATIHWLVQIAMYNDHLLNSSASTSFFQGNSMFVYALDSYLHYIRGNDDSVEEIDTEFMNKLQKERDGVAENLKDLERVAEELSAKLEGLKSAPNAREAVEKDRLMLEEDVRKFQAMVEQLSGKLVALEKGLEEKERELGAKEEERRRICEENEELKRRVEAQTVNARDAERMKRELQAVERETGEAEGARNKWEEKSWDLDASVGRKFKEFEALSIECNQAIRRLKLGNEFQYMLNAKGSTPVEVLGIDYKSTLKPALDSFADGIKKSSMSNLEEMISLQQQLAESSAKNEAKRNRITSVQSHIDEMEAQLNSLRKETQDYTSQCAMEARNMKENVETEARNLDAVEREAEEILKISQLKLQETEKHIEEENQFYALELFNLVDSVSKYKEDMASKISDMKNDLSAVAGTISDVYRSFLPAQFGIDFDASH